MEKLFFDTGGGMRIAADAAGPADGPPVILLHGGGQTRHSWGKAVSRLAHDGYRAITIDLRGHGDSGWAKDADYSLDAHARDLRAVIAAVGGRPALVGASLGGLTSLLLVGEEPQIASALVLVDVVPQLEPEGTHEITSFMTSAPDGFASIEEAADAVAAYLPHRPRPPSTAGLMKNLRLRSDGRYHWHWDPRFLSTGKVDHFQDRLIAGSRRIDIPVQLVRGALSRVVSDRSVTEFRELMPHAEYVNIAGADHMVAGDRNDAFNGPLIEFLERTVAREPA